MPVYEYRAIKADGMSTEGIVDADTPREARSKLRAQNLMVTEIEAVVRDSAPQGTFRLPEIFKGRRLAELSLVTRQLGTLLNSGIALTQSLSALIEQMESRSLETAFRDIRERVQSGSTFGDALALYPRIFSDLYVNMVRAGEAAGNLDGVLLSLADYIHSQARLRGKVSAAMTYPIIMCLIAGGVVTFLLGYVVPQITSILIEQKKALPLVTEILIGITDFLRYYWWAILGGILGAWLLFKALVSTPNGRMAWDTFVLKVPLFGPLLKKQAVSRFSVTFATLLESGIPALEALSITRTVVDNMLMAATIDIVRTKIMEGADIATPLKRTKVFPPVVSYMIAIGEESGKLEVLLRRIAQMYDEEIDIATQKMTALLEPIMIVLMAGVVGFIVLSILLPILELSNVK